METLEWLLYFLCAFLMMEFNAWFAHKYVMHGFLWPLHEDHHVPNKNRKWQKNDFFSLFFATPSFLFILFDHLWSKPILGAIGFGIMAYGIAYFLVHEVLIHRRLTFIRVNHWYAEALNTAHKVHHSVKEKNGATNFGMLFVPLSYYSQAISRRRKRSIH